LEQAANQKLPIHVWCDLDLAGIRIARLIHDITGGIATPILMDPEMLDEWATTCPLSPENMARIRRDLEHHPGTLLANSLRAILDKRAWQEQEALLHNSRYLFSKLTERLTNT